MDELKERLKKVVDNEIAQGNTNIVQEISSKVPCWDNTVYRWLNKLEIKSRIYRINLDKVLKKYEVKNENQS